MRFLKIIGCLILFLILVSILRPKTVYAQSCSGTFACGDNVAHCQFSDGTPCSDCSGANPACSNVFVCQPPAAGFLDRSCSGGGGISACGAYGCGVSGCVLSSNCSSGPTCDATNCFNRACTDASGNACQCYGVCSAGSCVTGGIVPGTCSSSTPPVCSPGAWCGSACLSPCHTSDLYCNSTGTACNVQVGDYVGDWCGCSTAPTPLPSSGGGVPPPPPPPPPDPGACTPCSAGVCCAGATCDIGPPASCIGGAVPPPPVVILPTPTPSDFCGNGICGASEFCTTCPADCGVCTYTISGNVYIDANSNGAKDVGETNYNSGASQIIRLSDGSTSNTNSLGNYVFSGKTSGNYTVTLTVPSGYLATTINPRSVTIGPSAIANFGIRLVSPPACVPPAISLNPASSTVNPGASTTLSVTSCTDVENPNNGVPPPPFSWNPDTSGNNPPPTIGGQTDTPTSSTTTWTAPACPLVSSIYTPLVAVSGAGGSVNYTTSITVPGTYTVTSNVRSVAGVGACTSSSGAGYGGANLNITNSSTVNTNQTTNASGVATFTCLPGGNYQVTIALPSGYSLLGTNGGTSTSGNTININPLSSNSSVTFCIAPTNPWFQTNTGDVRFSNLLNPIPAGQYGASDASNPGVYFSSNSNLSLGNGTVSAKGWGVNYEYSFNANTINRNGTMGYGFLKSKARQDGVKVTPLTPGTFDQTQITGSGIYESSGDLTINSYTHTNGRRVVILVNGNVIINASNVTVPVGQGLFIVAAKGNITIAKTIGTATLTSTTANIDGYYTAEGSIIIDGDKCADSVTPDLRLNVGGALIANSLKPFATTGTGTLQNKRSLCTNNLTYPSLFVSSRPDFLTQLTDFYKVSYTKWQEAKP